jgi:hypothetical protein
MSVYFPPLQVRTLFNTKSGVIRLVQDKAHICDLTLPELWHGLTKVKLQEMREQGGFVRSAVLGYHRANPDPHVEVLKADWKVLELQKPSTLGLFSG